VTSPNLDPFPSSWFLGAKANSGSMRPSCKRYLPSRRILFHHRASDQAASSAIVLQRRCFMKAGIFFTGTGPILLLTSYEELNHPKFVEKMATKGIKKFIAFEIDTKKVQQRYGQQYQSILSDLKQNDDLRVLDYDGHHVFYNFSLNELGVPIYYDGGQ
jgi:hypothetical protein